MDEGVAEARRTPGARLVDVREEGEFLAGHVPDAANVPLSQLGRIADVAQDGSSCVRDMRTSATLGALTTTLAHAREAVITYLGVRYS